MPLVRKESESESHTGINVKDGLINTDKTISVEINHGLLAWVKPLREAFESEGLINTKVKFLSDTGHHAVQITAAQEEKDSAAIIADSFLEGQERDVKGSVMKAIRDAVPVKSALAR